MTTAPHAHEMVGRRAGRGPIHAPTILAAIVWAGILTCGTLGYAAIAIAFL